MVGHHDVPDVDEGVAVAGDDCCGWRNTNAPVADCCGCPVDTDAGYCYQPMLKKLSFFLALGSERHCVVTCPPVAVVVVAVVVSAAAVVAFVVSVRVLLVYHQRLPSILI